MVFELNFDVIKLSRWNSSQLPNVCYCNDIRVESKPKIVTIYLIKDSVDR